MLCLSDGVIGGAQSTQPLRLEHTRLQQQNTDLTQHRDSSLDELHKTLQGLRAELAAEKLRSCQVGGRNHQLMQVGPELFPN